MSAIVAPRRRHLRQNLRLVCVSWLLLVALPIVVHAQFNFTTNNGSITITEYTGSGGNVVIPKKIKGLRVTRIGDFAFAGSSVTSVKIPKGVTSIGDSAFRDCTKLARIVIPYNVTTIANSAFWYCPSLASVMIPSSVTSIGSNAFFHCSRLGDVTIPTSVTSIGAYAFEACSSLTRITIPAAVTTLEDGTFASCTKLAIVTIPTNTANIGINAFVSCSLTSITIPSSVTNIGSTAFGNCTSLSAITVDALNPAYSSKDGVLFDKGQTTLIQYPAPKVGSYTVPNNVISIGTFAFSFCASLTSVTIPNSVTNIENFAFQACGSLTGAYFQGNAPRLGANGFHFNNQATVYYLPGTMGWGPTFGTSPTMLWNPLVQTSDPSFGVHTNQFGFTITGTSNLVIVVEACADLANPAWVPLLTNTLTGGSFYFSDPAWTNFPSRLYRIRSQ